MIIQTQRESVWCVLVSVEYRSPTGSGGIPNVGSEVQITAKKMTSASVNSQYHLNL